MSRSLRLHKLPADAREEKRRMEPNDRSRPFTLITMLRVRYFLIKIIILVTSRCHVKKPRCLLLLTDEAYIRDIPYFEKDRCQMCLFERNFTRVGLVLLPFLIFSPWWILKAKTNSKGTWNEVAVPIVKSRQRRIDFLSPFLLLSLFLFFPSLCSA